MSEVTIIKDENDSNEKIDDLETVIIETGDETADQITDKIEELKDEINENEVLEWQKQAELLNQLLTPIQASLSQINSTLATMAAMMTSTAIIENQESTEMPNQTSEENEGAPVAEIEPEILPEAEAEKIRRWL